ncbi:MAG: sulfatase-like hydrolase/transferase [Elusimicrobia bacterium]|nr:sulfatase-like hydrolase/transferase [Elusimicrobiota bacterium]
MENKIDFSVVFNTFLKLIPFNIMFLLFMSLFRLVFFFYFANFSELKDLYDDVLQAFILGIRFDLVVIAVINYLVTISILIIWAVKKESLFILWGKILKWYYFFLFGFVFFILFVDFAFYSYFKDHINILIYGFFEDDTRALISTILKNPKFPAFLLIFLTILAGIYYSSKRVSKSLQQLVYFPRKPFKTYFKIVFIALLICAQAFSARGSLTMQPIFSIYEEISSNDFINKLSLNGVIALRKAIKYRMESADKNVDLAKSLGYQKNIREALADFLNISEEKVNEKDPVSNLTQKTSKNKIIEQLRPNVIFIVMESMGTKLLRYNRSDFDMLGELKKHFDQDYVFYNFLPAGLLTVHAIESLVLNIPQRPLSLEITQSEYAYAKYPFTLTLPYKKAGYETILVYGGGLNWRDLSTFFSAQGFDKLLGEGSMEKGSQKNEWGVYDEYLFNALYKELSANDKKPKFIFALTTGNHPPYLVPDTYKPKPIKMYDEFRKVINGDEKMVSQRLITYQYANQKLGEFITKVKNSKFGKNTIIAVTGDHNFWDIFSYGSKDLFNKYSVPFYLYIPEKLKPKKVNTKVFGSHIDIMPTLYNLSLSNASYIAMGKNMLDQKLPHFAYNSEGFIISEKGAVKYDIKDNKIHFYKLDNTLENKLISTEKSSDLDKMLGFYKASMAIADYLIKGSKKSSKK